jgi:hypothetical protein
MGTLQTAKPILQLEGAGNDDAIGSVPDKT